MQRHPRQRPKTAESGDQCEFYDLQVAVPTPPTPRQPTPQHRKPVNERSRRGALCPTRAVGRINLPDGVHPLMVAWKWMRLEQNNPARQTATCSVCLEVTSLTRSLSEGSSPRGMELLAFVDSDAVHRVLPKTPCNENPLVKTTSSRSGIGFKGANGPHSKHHGKLSAREEAHGRGNQDPKARTAMSSLLGGAAVCLL